MNYNPERNNRRSRCADLRRSIRLTGYDYSQAGYYFVTICCDRRQRLFGDIINRAKRPYY